MAMRQGSSLQQTLNAYGSRPIPTPSQELHLATLVRAWLDHPDGADNAPRQVQRAGLKARNHLIQGNLRWVVAVAKKYCRGGTNEDRFMEAIQAGALGLTRAVERFDPTRGYKLSTFSYFWILQHIQRGEETRTAIRLPDAVMQEYRRIEKAIRRLTDEGFPVTGQTIAEVTGLTPERVSQRIEIGRMRVVTSLDSPGSTSNEAGCLGDFVAAPETDLDDKLLVESMRYWLNSNVDCLSEKRLAVFTATVQGKTQKQIAHELNISRAAVGQRLHEAKAELQQRLREQQQPTAA